MFNVPFMLAFDPKSLITIGMLVLVIVVFYFLMIRPQKKREKEANEMRDNLRVGDEVTTIGGIVGKIVSLRDETFVLETTKDKTHIRFLRAAIRSVDVRAEDSVDPTKKETPAEKPVKNGKKKKKAAAPSETVAVETEVATVEAIAADAESVDAPAEGTAVETEVASVEAVSESGDVTPEGKKD